MLYIGKKQTLKVKKQVEFGVYLTDGREDVLLPAKQVPAGCKIGDDLEVFLYKDSKDRLIATVREPLIELGQIKWLEVKETGKIGAFLDWGLEKDLLLPFREQTRPVNASEKCLVSLYVDKSKRLCATMRLYDYLDYQSPYQHDDEVQGTVYEIKEPFGVYVAVDDHFSGMLPYVEGAGLKAGDKVTARVTNVKEDGKLDLSIRKKAYLQMDEDAKKVLEVIREYDGVLPFNDKASSEVITREFQMSKNAFKRAVGKLYKERVVEITSKSIRIIDK